MRAKLTLTAVAMMPILFGVASAIGTPAQSPELILAHGTVLTIDPQDTIAEAIAIRDGKILAVGRDAVILPLAGPSTRLIDLHGLTATPGLIDSHAHVALGGVSEVTSIQLGDATSVAEVVQRVQKKAAQLKAGEWIQGRGWDEGKLKEARYVLAADLDAVAPNNPVWLEHTTGHYGVANSRALHLAEVTSATPNPVAGTIDRDSAGAPTGVLKEKAMHLVTDLIPPPTPAEWRAGIRKLIDTLHGEGMTAFKDPDDTQPMWDAYSDLLKANELTVRVCVLWHGGTTVESARTVVRAQANLPSPKKSPDDARLLSCGAKIFMDGSGGGRTAWMYREWNRNWKDTDQGNFGYPALEPNVYREMVRVLHQAGIHVATHAIGDRAIDWVVDTYAATLQEKPTRGLRHAIIHDNLPTQHAMAAMADLQKRYDAGYPEMQPPFMWWLGDNYAGNLGPARAPQLEPLKSLLEHGVQWTGGSDYPVVPIPARYGIWAALQRETLKGTYGAHPFGSAEAVDVHAALRAYTAAAARQLFLEDQIGSIERGKQADIAVWDRNPYAVSASELKELRCKMTLFHGAMVYESSP